MSALRHEDEAGIFARLTGKKPVAGRSAAVDERIAEEQRAARGQSRDGRKTGRTAQFNVRLQPALVEEIRGIAATRDKLTAQVIETAMEALRQKLKKSGK